MMSVLKSTSISAILVLVLIALGTNVGNFCCAFTSSNNNNSNLFLKQVIQKNSNSINAGRLMALSNREMEIRRKIRQLKKEGRIKKQQNQNEYDDDYDDDDNDNSNTDDVKDIYADKVRQKLGAGKSKLLGFNDNGNKGTSTNDEDKQTTITTSNEEVSSRKARLGALPVEESKEDDDENRYKAINEAEASVVVGSSFETMDDDDDDDSDSDDADLSEEDLVELVAQRMQEKEKKDRERREKEAKLKMEARKRLLELEQERQSTKQKTTTSTTEEAISNNNKEYTTSGVGGTWDKNTATKVQAEQDMYQPKSGSWGAFPRPRDISKAYGGGRRIGPGYSNESDEVRKMKKDLETRERLQQYRIKAGIDVPSEKEHADEIAEALNIAQLAMSRGVYSTAVTALEKVTRYCSTNSKVGGEIFLELAMAYEANGRTKEAITVYRALTTSRIEKIKINAKRLLYGIEAMQFMQQNVNSNEFSRKRASATFIDTTGLANIASKFDDVYETAYVDLNRNFYKQLTQSIVRNAREARQILLHATGPGEVERMKIVQALRSLSRHFSDALQNEIDQLKPKPEPTAVINGKPIIQESDDMSSVGTTSTTTSITDEFVLMDAEQMKDNLQGEWRLQLLADKRGDGVKFFNNTLSWQYINTNDDTFTSYSPQGFIKIQQSGLIEFNNKRRILRRKSIQLTNKNNVLAGLFGKSGGGAIGAINTEQQIISVDSIILITRNVPSLRTRSSDDNEKDYFAVWRRVEPGTFSS